MPSLQELQAYASELTSLIDGIVGDTEGGLKNIIDTVTEQSKENSTLTKIVGISQKEIEKLKKKSEQTSLSEEFLEFEGKNPKLKKIMLKEIEEVASESKQKYDQKKQAVVKLSEELTETTASLLKTFEELTEELQPIGDDEIANSQKLQEISRLISSLSSTEAVVSSSEEVAAGSEEAVASASSEKAVASSSSEVAVGSEEEAKELDVYIDLLKTKQKGAKQVIDEIIGKLTYKKELIAELIRKLQKELDLIRGRLTNKSAFSKTISVLKTKIEIEDYYSASNETLKQGEELLKSLKDSDKLIQITIEKNKENLSRITNLTPEIVPESIASSVTESTSSLPAATDESTSDEPKPILTSSTILLPETTSDEPNLAIPDVILAARSIPVERMPSFAPPKRVAVVARPTGMDVASPGDDTLQPSSNLDTKDSSTLQIAPQPASSDLRSDNSAQLEKSFIKIIINFYKKVYSSISSLFQKIFNKFIALFKKNNASKDAILKSNNGNNALLLKSDGPEEGQHVSAEEVVAEQPIVTAPSLPQQDLPLASESSKQEEGQQINAEEAIAEQPIAPSLSQQQLPPSSLEPKGKEKSIPAQEDVKIAISGAVSDGQATSSITFTPARGGASSSSSSSLIPTTIEPQLQLRQTSPSVIFTPQLSSPPAAKGKSTLPPVSYNDFLIKNLTRTVAQSVNDVLKENESLQGKINELGSFLTNELPTLKVKVGFFNIDVGDKIGAKNLVKINQAYQIHVVDDVEKKLKDFTSRLTAINTTILGTIKQQSSTSATLQQQEEIISQLMLVLEKEEKEVQSRLSPQSDCNIDKKFKTIIKQLRKEQVLPSIIPDAVIYLAIEESGKKELLVEQLQKTSGLIKEALENCRKLQLELKNTQRKLLSPAADSSRLPIRTSSAIGYRL